MTKTKNQKPTTNEVTAILLAAGQSKRMGTFKPLLSFGDTTVIQSCINNLQAGGVDGIVVVGGQHGPDLGTVLEETTQTHFVINPDSESEMGDSIACGIRSLPETAKAVLIALTDQPAVPPEVVTNIIESWRNGAQLIIPEFNGHGGHPVLLDLKFREELLTLDPQRGLKGLFADNRSQVLRLPVNSPYIARDMDTWDDYRALHEDVFGAPPSTLDR